MRVRLLELQNEFDSLQACAAAGRLVPEPNLRGWAALLPLEPAVLAEGLRHGGLTVLLGSNAALALGSLTQRTPSSASCPKRWRPSCALAPPPSNLRRRAGRCRARSSRRKGRC
jgi:hypothetical protein